MPTPTPEQDDIAADNHLRLKTDAGWSLQADDANESLRLDIYDVIGEDWAGGGVSGKSVAAAINEHPDAKQIDVHINSPGGLAFDGTTIYNVLAQHRAKVRVTIDGLAASAASIVAMAGDEIRIAENAMMMIHCAQGFTLGDAATHLETATVLEKLDKTIATTYARRSGGDADDFLELMEKATWFTAEEAIAAGLATDMMAAKRIAAMFDPCLLDRLGTVPDAARAWFAQPDPATATTTGDSAMPENTTVTDLTPEQFAEQHPEAIEQWRDEGRAAATAELETAHADAIKAAQDQATDDAVLAERDRCTALAESFGNWPAFLTEQIKAGHDLPAAKAAAFDQKLSDQRPGVDPITLPSEAAPTNVADVPADKLEARKRFENNDGGVRDKFRTLNAYWAFVLDQKRHSKPADA